MSFLLLLASCCYCICKLFNCLAVACYVEIGSNNVFDGSKILLVRWGAIGPLVQDIDFVKVLISGSPPLTFPYPSQPFCTFAMCSCQLVNCPIVAHLTFTLVLTPHSTGSWFMLISFSVCHLACACQEEKPEMNCFDYMWWRCTRGRTRVGMQRG